VFEKTGTLTNDRLAVSKMFYDGKELDTSLNWETYQLQVKKLKDEQMDDTEVFNSRKVKSPGYESELESSSFKMFLEVITMSTEAFFDF